MLSRPRTQNPKADFRNATRLDRSVQMPLHLIMCPRGRTFFLRIPLIAPLQFCRVRTQAKCERCHETSRPQSKHTATLAVPRTTSLGPRPAATQSHERLFAGWSTHNLRSFAEDCSSQFYILRPLASGWPFGKRTCMADMGSSGSSPPRASPGKASVPDQTRT